MEVVAGFTTGGLTMTVRRDRREGAPSGTRHMSDANETPVHAPTEGEGLSLQSSDPRALWDALTHDAEVGVLVVDTQGRIQFANAAVQGALGAGEVDLRGKSWHDLLPKDVADERVRCAEQVVRTSQPIALIGMIGGGCRCAIFRPVESDAHKGARVLVICRPLTAMDREPKFDAVDGCAVVIAQFNDLGPLSALTEREFEVLAFIGEGLSTAEIAQRLHRSVKTVEWHRRLLGSKLEATNRVELARIAIRAGLTHLGIVDTRPRISSRRTKA